LNALARTGLIFDMDGTLVESEHLHQESWIAPLLELGIAIDDDIYADHFAGKPGLHIIRDFVGLSGQGALDLYAKVNLAYWDLAVAQVVPITGLRTVLDAWFGASMAVCTSAQRASADRMLELLEIRDYFRAVVTATDVTNGKPHPEPFLLAASLIGQDPERCIAVEDSAYGLIAARAAGMFCVGIGAGESRYPDLADGWIRDYDDPRLETVLGAAGFRAGARS
jgi:HAD superfamily hydrolase (TIGR01509 family)